MMKLTPLFKACIKYILDIIRFTLTEEKGQGMVEYAFILLTIALVVIIGLANLADELNDFFSTVVNLF